MPHSGCDGKLSHTKVCSDGKAAKSTSDGFDIPSRLLTYTFYSKHFNKLTIFRCLIIYWSLLEMKFVYISSVVFQRSLDFFYRYACNRNILFKTLQ